jgi:hypothetical protein
MGARKTQSKKEDTKDPFSTRKTKGTGKKDIPVLDPQDSIIRSAVDDFVAAANKEAEGKAAKIAPKDTIEGSFARMAFAERFCSGQEGSIRIAGNDEQVILIQQDKSDVTTENELADIADKWGEDVMDLFEKDYSSININGKFLKDNWDHLIPKLTKALGDDFGELFSEAKYKSKPGIAHKVKEFVNNDPVKFDDLSRDCKIRTFIRK